MREIKTKIHYYYAMDALFPPLCLKCRTYLTSKEDKDLLLCGDCFLGIPIYGTASFGPRFTLAAVMESLNINLLPLGAVSQSKVIKPPAVVQVSFTLKGSYASIKEYIEALETNVRIMDVKTLAVQGGTEGEVLTYNVVVDAYYQR